MDYNKLCLRQKNKMAKAVAARTLGDDYQARLFWLQVCRLFEDRPKVTEVEIEAENVKSFDDVVVHYSGLLVCDEVISCDYYQVKFHMTANGAFTWEGMMDPSFINAVSVSLIERLRNVQVRYAPNGKGCCFYVYSPWATHPDDVLSKLVSKTDGHIRWDVLCEGSERSAMGKVRMAWRKHLDLASDEDLRKVLAPLRLECGYTLAQLGDRLNDKLQLAGLRPVPEGTMVHPYEVIAKKLVQSGRTKLNRQDIESLCKKEGLWIGKTILDPEARRIGIRSFLRFAEYLEDETDEMLCLLKHFEGRRIRNPTDWDNLILPVVIKFLQGSIRPGSRYLLNLPTHGTIAFLAGWYLDSKSGANIGLVQAGVQGRQVWSSISSDAVTSACNDWQVTSIPLAAGRHDVALAISVTHNIESDVAVYVRKQLPSLSQILCCRSPILGSNSIRDGAHAYSLSQQISVILKTQRTLEEHTGRIHLFLSAPNSFAFFLGQLSRSFGPLTLYEYDFDTNPPGAYWPAISLPPPSISLTPGGRHTHRR